MTQPLVSIVIPYYNHRHFIERAAKNLFKQSYQNWEGILVDNNSSDGSGEIARAIAKQHPEKIRYAYQKIQGIPYAYNKGLEQARGEYVCFLDVDDEFAASKLTDQVPILERHPEVGMAYGLTRRIYLGDKRNFIQDTGIAHQGVNEPPYLGIDWLSCFYHLPQGGAALIRISIAREVGGFAENLLMGNDDVAFFVKLALNYKVWFLPKEAVCYYRHSRSEGARLNREKSVTSRYLDTYASWIVPYTYQYEKRTGDSRPKYWAQRGLANNLAASAYQVSKSRFQRRKTLYTMLREQRKRGYLLGTEYSALFGFYSWLPRCYARLTLRAFYRVLFLFSPKRFPIFIPGQKRKRILKIPVKRIKYYIRRWPLYYRLRYFLILRIGTRELFESEDCNRYCPQGKIPEDFLSGAAGIRRPKNKSLQGAINIAYDLSHGHSRGRGLGYCPSDCLKIIYSGGGGVCSDYTQVFTGLCLGADIRVREWGVSFDNCKGDNGHAFCEIFSTEHKKWVFIDPYKSFWVSLKSDDIPLSAIELINLSQKELSSSINLNGIDRDHFNQYRDSVLELYNFSENIFFLLSNNRIFDQAKFLRYGKIIPSPFHPILHILMIIFGCYQRFNIYLPQAREKEVLDVYKRAKKLI